MRKVWKVTIAALAAADPGGMQLTLPGGACHVHTDLQDGEITAWFEVTPDSPPAPWTFRVYGTGHEIDPGFTHLGTTLHHGGQLVLHLYAKRPDPWGVDEL